MMAGVGILSLPHTLSQGGWTSLIFIYISGAIAAYNGVLLIECLYANPQKKLKTFPEVGFAAFGKWGSFLVQFFHYLVLLGVSTIFIMLIGINVAELAANSSAALDLKLWTLIAGLIVATPLVISRTVKEITFLGALGAISTILVIFVVLGLGLGDLPNQHNVIHSDVVWRGLPAALATISFSFGGNNVYPHIESGMTHPKQWRWVMISAISTVCIAYTIICVAGYYVYGAKLNAHVLVNLPESGWRTASYVFITLHILFTAPIVLCSACIEFEKIFLNQTVEMKSTWGMWIQRAGLRLVVLAAVTCMAIFVPDFGDFMSLIGAIGGLMVSFILPPLFHLKLFGWRNRSILTYIWIFLIFAVGIFGAIMGTIDAVISLNKFFNSPEV
jgi:amino acid permease